MNRTRPLRFLPAAALASLAACGSPENSASSSAAPPPSSVPMPPSAQNFTGAALCALLTDPDKQALGLTGPSQAWDRPYKMGGTRRARCRWNVDGTELDFSFHDADMPQNTTFSTDAEVSQEQIHGRDAKVITFRGTPMSCAVLLALHARSHLSVDATPVSSAPDEAENCALAKRVAQTAASRIQG
ncbi:DUF3558 domain-containing protein [Amycolatopsis sp. FU40]|uniref:DUF3558 family protein n=1 Tax=Amycolatopsis sp. FU40 TaxID=2914159 RepID=UPI001F1C9AD3|nr:DUF3558 family protein [Amycolatopsis sp. FU40]UKD59730.1 DUF3558 domain-containing protein [Amycolatopsis sp. FU40]